jgi:PAS domain S-box-containing protein
MPVVISPLASLFADAAPFMAAVDGAADVAVIGKSLDGTIEVWSSGAERLFGYKTDEAIGRSITMLIPNARAAEEPRILARIRAGESVPGYETVRRTKSGTLIDIIVSIAPVRDSTGTIVGALKFARLIPELERADRAQRLLAAIVESSDDAIISKDLNGIITSWNRGAERVFGYAAVEAIGRSILLIVPPERNGEEAVILAKIRSGEPVDHIETVRRRKDGSSIDISLTISPIRDRHGTIVGASKIARDISPRIREERTRAALQEKEVLLKEIHHRVKNNLQVTSSLLKLQSEYIDDPAARAMFVESQNRIRSMALVHEKLYRSDNLSSIDFVEYAESLAVLLNRSFGAAERGIMVTVSGETLRFPIDVAVPSGLILNELIWNAVRHGFPPGRSGRVEVRIRHKAGIAYLCVADNGAGLPDGFSSSSAKSLGLELISTLTGQVHGTLRIKPRDWTEFEVSFPFVTS